MKTNLEKLRELLCTVPEIEKDIKELRKWCLIEAEDFPWEHFEYLYELEKDEQWYTWIQLYRLNDKNRCEFFHVWKEEIWCHKIIWNPLQERHLRMYCKEKWIENVRIKWCWEMVQENEHICRLDNTKDLESQSEETLGKILDFLTK